MQLVKDRELEYKTVVRSSDMAAELGHQIIQQNDREHMIVVSLNAQHKPVNVNIAHVGTVNECPTHPCEILKPAIISNAVGLIVLHNHPNGDVTPSENDKVFTDNIRKACELMCIDFLDSVIIGEPGTPHFSFADEGLLD